MQEIRAAHRARKLDIKQNQYRIAARVAVSHGGFVVLGILRCISARIWAGSCQHTSSLPAYRHERSLNIVGPVRSRHMRLRRSCTN